jgi:modulator of FtsH protease
VPWHDFFIGVARAAAALTGLLFVSLSINLEQILRQAWLPRRAALTLKLLFETLVLAILELVPGQSPGALGVEYLSVGGAVWLFATGVYTVRRPAVEYRPPIVPDVATSQLATLPVIVAGASLVAGSGGGLYWLLPAIVLLLGVGVMKPGSC